MSILARIHAHGGAVVLDGLALRIRRGRLDDAALAWVKAHRDDLMREVMPNHDAWEERAAIREYDGGQTREEAEAAAFEEVSRC